MTKAAGGKIITFYSYKGGTGRSMSLANVAWILASNGKRVLAIDWDLEAPGLHRYFAPFLVDREVTATEGLIDFVTNFAVESMTRKPEDSELPRDWHKQHADILKYAVSLRWKFREPGTLDFVPAGQQGDSYSARVNSFNWQTFYDRQSGGAFLEAAKERMREEYDFILIDSRTGVSDTSGICTVQMPDALVVCFTLNNQSLEGAAAVANSAFEQRRESKIEIFPVPMRVEPFERRKLDLRKEYARAKFAGFPEHLPERLRSQFEEDVQVPYFPYYAYEEILATFGDKPGERMSLLSPAERLVEYLTKYLTGVSVNALVPPPEKERREVLARFEGEPIVEVVIATANKAVSRLSPEERKTARRVLSRLVRLAHAYEGGEDVAVKFKLTDFDQGAQEIARRLAADQVLKIEPEAEGGATVALAHEALLKKWSALREGLDAHRPFLLWRQQLNGNIAEWKRLEEDNGLLLSGAALDEAMRWMDSPGADLNEAERSYVIESNRYRIETERGAIPSAPLTTAPLWATQQRTPELGRKRKLIIAATTIILVITAFVVTFSYRKQQRAEQTSALIAQAFENLRSNNYDLAVNSFREALKSDPYDPNLHVGIGDAYFSMGDYGKAVASFSEALRLKPSNTELYEKLGDAYFNKRDGKGDYDRAIENYGRAVSSSSTSASSNYPVLLKLGLAQAGKGDNDQADQTYSEVIRHYESIKSQSLSPDDRSVYAKASTGRGNVRFAKGDFTRALGDYDTALRHDTDSFDAYLNRGSIHARLGDYGLAFADFENAIRINSHSARLYFERANAYMKTGDRRRALLDYEKVEGLNRGQQADSQIDKIVQEALKLLTMNPPAKSRIYLHYQDSKDAAAVDAIGKALSASTFSVKGKERVTQPTSGDVRYFYEEDAATARQIKAIVERVLAERGAKILMELRLIRSLAVKVPQGWLEVWLPSLPEVYPTQGPFGPAKKQSSSKARQQTPNKVPPKSD